MEVFKVSAQARVQQGDPHFLALRMRRLKGFFALFLELEKVRGPAGSAEITRQMEFPRWAPIKWLVRESPRTRAHRRRRLMSWRSESTSTAARGWLRLVCLGGGGCSATASLGTSSGMSLVRRWRRRRGRAGRCGRVFKVFSQDTVLQRFVEQIFGDFLGLDRVQQRASWSRTTWREFGGAVLRRDRLEHCLTWNLDTIFYESVTETLCQHVLRQSTETFGRIS